MKRLLLACVFAFLPLAAFAAEGPQGLSAKYPIFLTSAVVTSNTQVKALPGYVAYMVCIGTDAAAQAASIILSDATAEDTGTTVVTWAVQAAYNYATPLIFPVQRNFDTGIYLNYTATADIGCYVVYR